MRVLIVGGPRCGKTTQSLAMGQMANVPVRHTDSLIATHSWSQMSDAVSGWLDQPGPWIIEGMAGVRGLRKWMRNHPDKVPDFEVRAMFSPFVPQTVGQQGMAGQALSIYKDCLEEIEKRKAKVSSPPAE